MIRERKHKLGVAFSYLERNNFYTRLVHPLHRLFERSDDTSVPVANEFVSLKVLCFTVFVS